jgi:hypothetical protein
MDLVKFREEYPEYDDMSDKEVIGNLHKNYYSDYDYEEFSNKLAGTMQKEEKLKPPVTAATPAFEFDKDILSGRSSYDGMLKDYAMANEIPAELFKRQMMQESNGDPTAVSKAGAQGLMQIMPGTQKDLGIKNPFDPEESVDDILAGKQGYPQETLDYVKRITGVNLLKHEIGATKGDAISENNWDDALQYIRDVEADEAAEKEAEKRRRAHMTPRQRMYADRKKPRIGQVKEGGKDVGRQIGTGVLSLGLNETDLEISLGLNETDLETLRASERSYRRGHSRMSPVEEMEWGEHRADLEKQLGRPLTVEEHQEHMVDFRLKRNKEWNAIVQKSISYVQEKLKADPEYAETQGFWEDVFRMGPQIGMQIVVGLTTGGLSSGAFMFAQILGGTYV